MMRCSSVLLAFLLVVGACGGDNESADAAATADAVNADSAQSDAAEPDATVDALPPDAATGLATITGTVAAEDVAPMVVYHTVHPVVENDIIVMPEDGLVCDLDSIGDGQLLVIGFPCGPPVAIAYPVVDSSDENLCTGGAFAFVLVEGFTGGTHEYNAESGTVTITSATPQVVGELSADFGTDGSLSGSFTALVCE